MRNVIFLSYGVFVHNRFGLSVSSTSNPFFHTSWPPNSWIQYMFLNKFWCSSASIVKTRLNAAQRAMDDAQLAPASSGKDSQSGSKECLFCTSSSLPTCFTIEQLIIAVSNDRDAQPSSKLSANSKLSNCTSIWSYPLPSPTVAVTDIKDVLPVWRARACASAYSKNDSLLARFLRPFINYVPFYNLQITFAEFQRREPIFCRNPLKCCRTFRRNSESDR